MPVGFWNDPDNRKYHAAYFERFPTSGARRFSGADRARRRDHLRPLRRHAQPRRRAHRYRRNLSPGGAVAGNLESLVIGQDWPPGRSDDVRVVLFVKLQEGVALDAALVDRIKKRIRTTPPPPRPRPRGAGQDIPRTKRARSSN